MIPKLHPKGMSFQGVARYVLGAARGGPDERVAWTQTHNLATRNPEAAWRVMAATAIDRERLKREAGIKNTGRKSALCVLHFTLSWHPEERERLSAEEMARAARVVLRVMGAEEHQALVVAHVDKPQPHVHVVVNRVHPRDGRMLSSSFEKLKASRWAQQYEEERGKVYCVERVLNNSARERGEYRRGEKDEPRAAHESRAAGDIEGARRVREERRQECAELKRQERRLTRDSQEKLASAERQYLEKKGRLQKETRRVTTLRRDRVRGAFRQKWRALYHEQAAQRASHQRNERRLLGRVRNALASLDLPGLLAPGPRRLRALSEAFGLLASAGARKEGLRKRQEAEREALGRRQRKVEKQVVGRTRTQGRQRLSELRRSFIGERNEVVLKTRMERAKLRARWLESGRRLRERLRELGVEPKSRWERSPRPTTSVEPTRAADLLPARGADAAARRIDEWRELRGARERGEPRSRSDLRER